MPDHVTFADWQSRLAAVPVALLLVASLAYVLLTRTSVLVWIVVWLGLAAAGSLLWLLYRLVVAVEEIAESV